MVCLPLGVRQAVAPERIWKWGAPVRGESGGTDPAQSAGIFFVWGGVPLHFLALKAQLQCSRFGKRFRDGQYSLVSFLFAVLLLTVPPPRAPCSRHHWHQGAEMPRLSSRELVLRGLPRALRGQYSPIEGVQINPHK